MPAIDPDSNLNVIPAKSRVKRTRYGAAGRGADTTSSAPEPKTRGTAFTPVGSTRPFQRQQEAAQTKVDRSRRRLPAPRIAAPPIIENPSPAQTRAAKAQIVRSVRSHVAGLTGRERQAATARLMREIGTDPRLAATRRAIAHYSAAERAYTAPQTRAVAHVGRGDRTLGSPVGASFLPEINLSAARRRLQDLTPGLQTPDGPGQFARNALKDVGTLASAPFVGGLAVADVAGDVAQGDFGEAARKVGGFAEGVAASTVHDIKHPEDAIREHPLLTALNLAGAASVAGRVGGAVARGAGSTAEAGGLRGALARGGSTVRPPIALLDDASAGGLVERTYSKDLTRKAAQVAADARREPLRHEDGSVVTVTQRGREVPVLKPTGELERARLARGRGDFVASRANLSERLARDEAGGESTVRGRAGAAVRRSDAPGVRGRAARDVVAMVAEGTVRSAATFETDLRARLKTVTAKLDQHESAVRAGRDSPYRDSGEVAKAQHEVAVIEKVLGSPRALAQKERIVEAGVEHGRRQVASERENVAAGLFTGGGEQAQRARLMVAAQAHLGAEHGKSAALTARAEKARRIERSIHARLNFHVKDPKERARLEKQLEQVRAMRVGIEERNTERLRGPDGRALDPPEIEAMLRAQGRDPETVAFLPHRADVVGGAAYHSQFRPGARPTMDKPGATRTGEAYARGAQGTTADLLAQQGVRQRVQLSKARQIDRLVNDHGVRHPAWAKAQAGQQLTKHERRVVARGGYFTGPEAKAAIERAEADGGQRLAAMTAYPARLDADTARIVRDDFQGPAGMESLGQRLLNSRFLSEAELKSGRARNVVLVNRDLVDRLNKHLTPASGPKRFAQVLNKAFRYAVLPQPRWLTGNFVEPYLVRLTVAGSGVNVFGLAMDIHAANKTLKVMDRSGDPRVRQAAQEIRAQQLGGLFVGGRGATVRRGLGDFPVLDAAAKKAYGKMVARVPATRQMAEMSDLLLRKGGKAILAPLETFFAINRVIEGGAQRAALGRSIRRDVQEHTGSWLKTVRLGQKAAEEAGRGLVNTPTQHRFMKAQHELLGKYDGYSPTVRAIIQGPAPFLPWALNAARFTMWTMPAHHTALTALLVQVNDVVAKDWEEIHKPVSGLKGGLQLAIPNGKGGWVDIARYTPWGLSGPVAKGDPRALTSQFFPQISGASSAVEGKDAFGRDLVTSDGKRGTEIGLVKRLALAGQSVGEATVPYASTGRRLREGGETAFADSTLVSPRTKPGTAHGMGAARRVFDPLRPTYVGGGSGSTGAPAVATRVDPADAALERALDAIDAADALAADDDAALERALDRIR